MRGIQKCLFMCACAWAIGFGNVGFTAETPSDSELEARQARIGRIAIQVDDVFETTQRLAAPYRLVNALHINSRSSTIEAQLLFHSGDVFERRVLDESERLLRGQRYLNAATIEVVGYNEADNTVDLNVRVHDVWTLSPGFSYGRKGGANSTNLNIEENNLFGLGKRVDLSYSQDVDRNSLLLHYLDPNILGSWWRLSSSYAQSSDGDEKSIDIARPFYSLDTRWSIGTALADASEAVSKYGNGAVTEEYSMHRQLLAFNGGWSQGLKDGWVRRYLAGVRYESREFSQFQAQPALLPADRVIAYPWLGIEVIEDDYRETFNLDQIGRTEDIHLGESARVEVGFASSALGSTHSAATIKGSLGLGSEIGKRQLWFNDFIVQGRIEDGKAVNATIDLNSRYYFRQSPHFVFFAEAGGTVTSNLDPELQLLLGGDNGLRGYPLRFQAGTSRALFTLEQRFYTDWQPLKLFTVGAAAFFDAGRTWGHDEFGGEDFGLLKDVGFGLRLGNARSALGNVLHLDVAFPLDAPAGISHVQFIVETRRSF
jgi:hypothetical protein